MRINVNTSAVNTHRIMTENSQRQDKNLERLASGPVSYTHLTLPTMS